MAVAAWLTVSLKRRDKKSNIKTQNHKRRTGVFAPTTGTQTEPRSKRGNVSVSSSVREGRLWPASEWLAKSKAVGEVNLTSWPRILIDGLPSRRERGRDERSCRRCDRSSAIRARSFAACRPFRMTSSELLASKDSNRE